jgi:hypothetical protein
VKRFISLASDQPPKKLPVSLPFWQPVLWPPVHEPPGFTVGVLVTLDGTPEDAGGVIAFAFAFAAADDVLVLLDDFVFDVDFDPDEPEPVLLEDGVDDEPVLPALLVPPPPPPLTVTWMPLFFGVLEPASPISTPTPSASSSVAIPASSVALGVHVERRGPPPDGAGAGVAACIAGSVGCRLKRGFPRRVPHSTQ